MTAIRTPYSSNTGICVSGRGNPACTNNNRVNDSYGDSAPPSTRSSVRRSCRRPRTPGCNAATDSISLAFTSVAFMRASTRWTPATSSRRLPDVECGAGGSGHAHAVDASSLACLDAVGVHDQHRRRSTIRVDQFGGQARLYPLDAQHRSGRQTGEHTPAARPQPCGPCSLSSRKLDTTRNVHSWILDRPAHRTDAVREPTTVRRRRPPTREVAIPIPLPMAGAWRRPPTATPRLCRFVHRSGVSRTTPHSRRLKNPVANVT